MKRTIAILLTALMLTGVLTACSGTVGMDDGRAYGNVSTTPNGTVNGGTNGNYRNGTQNGNSGSYGGGYGYNGATGGSGSYQSGNANTYGSGTGMTGGR